MTAAQDEEMIDAVVAAFYAAFDNRGGRKIDILALRNLLTRDAHFTRMSADRAESSTVEEFFAPRNQILSNGTLADFHEWEHSSTSTIVGNIASRLSTYEKTGCRSGKSFREGGTKHIQLCRCEGEWRIDAVLWEDAW